MKTLRFLPALFVGIGLATGPSVASAAGVVPAEFQGVWVPAKASCDSPLRLQVGADRLTLRNGHDSEPFAHVEMAGSGYFAPGYAGIMAVLIAELTGDQPVMATFNVREKRGVAQVDFAPVLPGKGSAQQVRYNAHVSKLDLARRFPIHQAPLKRCAAA
jgi:hypothetical protein